MATITPDTKEEQDEAYSPQGRSARELNDAENFDALTSPENMDKNAVPGDLSGGVRKAEGEPLQNGFYKPSPGGKPQKITVKSFFKKKGPLAAIIALIVGGGGAFSIMFAPALGIVNLKEVLFNDLNDQLAAVDIRSMHVLKTKLKTVQPGLSVCSDTVKIRCKFSTFSKKQATAFKNAGFQIESESKAFGREAVTKMTFTDPATNAVIDINDPDKLLQAAKTNKNVRNALLRASNPKFYTLKDAVANKFTGGKHKRLTGTSPEALDKSMNESIKESTNRYGSVGTVRPDTDTDENGNKTQTNRDFSTTTGGVGNFFAGAARGVGLAGALDSACMVRSTSKAVQASSKVIRAAQMAAFAMVILNFADSVKAGDATWEEAEYVGNKFAATDTDKMVVNETSPLNGGVPEEVNNPYYGKSGYDAPGIKVATYNDTPTLTARDQQYTVGGGLVGTLSVVNAAIDTAIGPGGNATCGFVQNPFVRIGSAGIGIVLGVFSGGTSLAISVGASLAVSAALPLLETYLADMVAGETVGSSTQDVDAGNALFAGTSVMLGDIAKARGMKPATVEELETYNNIARDVKNDYIAYETELAEATPLDVMNQYSFLGTFARSINPSLMASSNGMSATISSMSSVFTTAFSNIIPVSKAVSDFNPERFQQCEDTAYAELGIDADVFCNVRYVMSERELAMDTDVALEYMLNNNFINEDGTPTGDYDGWLKECVNRQNGWGEQEREEGDPMTGAACMNDSYGASNADVAFFRVFTMDNSLSSAIDEEEPNVEEATQIASGAIVSPLPDGFVLRNGFGPRVKPCGSCSSWHVGQDMHNYNDSTVRSIRDGTVIDANRAGRNNVVKVQHADGLISTYWHMYAKDILVNTGDVVTAGQALGKEGNSGDSTGTHLHFELDITQVDDPAAYAGYTKNSGGFSPPGTRIDPRDYFIKNGLTGY